MEMIELKAITEQQIREKLNLQLDQKLKNLPRAMRSAAAYLKKKTAVLVPINTGKLRNSAKVSPVVKGPNGYTVYLTYGATDHNGEDYTEVQYKGRKVRSVEKLFHKGYPPRPIVPGGVNLGSKSGRRKYMKAYRSLKANKQLVQYTRYRKRDTRWLAASLKDGRTRDEIFRIIRSKLKKA